MSKFKNINYHSFINNSYQKPNQLKEIHLTYSVVSKLKLETPKKF